MRKEEFLSNPEKLLEKKPFTRGADENFIRLFRSETFDDESLVAEIPSFNGTTISQSQYLLELDPASHSIIYNEDLPRLASDPNVRWDDATPYRASFAVQAQVVAQHSQYVNGNGMKFTLLNKDPDEAIQQTFEDIKSEWVYRNMDIMKTKLYEAQKSMGDGALLFYFDTNGRLKTRLLTYQMGYQLIPQYDHNGEMILFSVYYKEAKEKKIDTYDEKFLYRYKWVEETEEYTLYETVAHQFDEIPVVYKRGKVAWEEGQVLIDIYELLYNIYMIVEKKVGFPILYVIGKPNLDRRSDTAVMLKDSTTSDMKSDAKFLNPSEPKGFQEMLGDVFKKIQIFTSSILLAPDDIKITADISGLALKILRSSIYERAQRDIMEYDEVADKMFELFKFGVSKELGAYTSWNVCKVMPQFQLWSPQSESEFVNRLVIQKQAGIISGETATEASPDAQPNEKTRLDIEKAREKEEEATADEVITVNKEE